MEMVKRLFSNDWFYALFLGLFGILVFWRVIAAHELIDIDHHIVIGPLYSIESWSDYWALFLGPKLYDIQPVRDLSLFLDIQFEQLIGHQVFGFTNVMIWIITCLIIIRIMGQFIDRTSAQLLGLILLIHPLLSWVLSWPVARKHLLSCLFITLASYFAIQLKKKGKGSFKVFICYFLSLFSQPISILWIGPFLLYFKNELIRGQHRRLAAVISITFLVALGVNYLYFSELYPLYAGTDKMGDQGPLGPALKLFAISRSFTQIFVPVQFASFYSPTTMLGMLGLPILSLFIWLLWAKKNLSLALFALVLLSYSLILVNLRNTNIFVADTYQLIPLTSFFIIFSVLIGHKGVRTLDRKILAVLVLGLFCVKTPYETSIATDNKRYFQVSYQREKNCRNALNYVHQLIIATNFTEFKQLAGDMLKNKCVLSGKNASMAMNQVYSFLVFMDEHLGTQEKLDQFKKIKRLTVYNAYLKSILLAELEREQESEALYNRVKLSLEPELRPALRKVHAENCTNKLACEKIQL
jgi:hypothetical protein